MKKTATSPSIAHDRRGTQGPRLLLIMGFGMRGSMWEPQIDQLAHDHQLAWFDHRGVGESAPAAGRYGMQELARDALAVADALGWDRFHVAGVSLGGMVTQELCLLAPERVQSATLIATHSGGPLGVVPHLRAAKLFVQANLGRDRLGALEQLLYPPEGLARVQKDALYERLGQQAGNRQSLRTALLQLLAVGRFDTRRRLAALRTPVLILQPTQDILIRPFHSERLARAIPGAELVRFEHAGHGLIFQEAAAVAAEIRRHVAAHDAPCAT